MVCLLPVPATCTKRSTAARRTKAFSSSRRLLMASMVRTSPRSLSWDIASMATIRRSLSLCSRQGVTAAMALSFPFSATCGMAMSARHRTLLLGSSRRSLRASRANPPPFTPSSATRCTASSRFLSCWWCRSLTMLSEDRMAVTETASSPEQRALITSESLSTAVPTTSFTQVAGMCQCSATCSFSLAMVQSGLTSKLSFFPPTPLNVTCIAAIGLASMHP
mmetsp:Transcript_6868/g.21437  ORF Transcript_6868/g.21437 Transcript_6868/m.21437 type:complete len:221 (-) Transcript_6868:7-669(-)